VPENPMRVPEGDHAGDHGGETILSRGVAFAFTGLVVALGPLALALLREKKT